MKKERYNEPVFEKVEIQCMEIIAASPTCDNLDMGGKILNCEIGDTPS